MSNVRHTHLSVTQPSHTQHCLDSLVAPMSWTLQSAYETYHSKLDWKRTLDFLLQPIQIYSRPCLLSLNATSFCPVVQIKIVKGHSWFSVCPTSKIPPVLSKYTFKCARNQTAQSSTREVQTWCFLRTWPATAIPRPPFCSRIAAWDKAVMMTWWSL